MHLYTASCALNNSLRNSLRWARHHAKKAFRHVNFWFIGFQGNKPKCITNLLPTCPNNCILTKCMSTCILSNNHYPKIMLCINQTL